MNQPKKKIFALLTAFCVVISMSLPVMASEDDDLLQIIENYQQFSELTEATQELLGSLIDDITIYYLVRDFDKDTYVNELLNSYAKASPHISVITKNPLVYPEFTADYTDETLPDNSLILVCGEQSSVISYDDMYEYEFNYSYLYVPVFYAEGLITSAIATMTRDDLPKIMYTLTGHGEVELTETLMQTITSEGIQIEDLNLEILDAVPDDTDCVLIASPLTDISAKEEQELVNYLSFGGSAIIITDYTTEEITNLNALLYYYGVELVDGIVLEGDSKYYYWQYPTYLIPEIESTEVSSDLAGGNGNVLLVEAQGIVTAEDIRDGVSVEPVLSTSQSAYSKTDVTSEILEKESGDIDGPFDLGVLITEDVEIMKSSPNSDATQSETVQTKLALFSSSVLINESADSMTSGGNYQLFTNLVNWTCELSNSISIPAKRAYPD